MTNIFQKSRPTCMDTMTALSSSQPMSLQDSSQLPRALCRHAKCISKLPCWLSLLHEARPCVQHIPMHQPNPTNLPAAVLCLSLLPFPISHGPYAYCTSWSFLPLNSHVLPLFLAIKSHLEHAQRVGRPGVEKGESVERKQ